LSERTSASRKISHAPQTEFLNTIHPISDHIASPQQVMLRVYPDSCTAKEGVAEVSPFHLGADNRMQGIQLAANRVTTHCISSICEASGLSKLNIVTGPCQGFSVRPACLAAIAARMSQGVLLPYRAGCGCAPVEMESNAMKSPSQSRGDEGWRLPSSGRERNITFTLRTVPATI
jgi:hypothetical protein